VQWDLSFAENYNRRWSILMFLNYLIINPKSYTTCDLRSIIFILNRNVTIVTRGFHYLTKKKLREDNIIISCLVDCRRVWSRLCFSTYDCFSVSLNSILFFIGFRLESFVQYLRRKTENVWLLQCWKFVIDNIYRYDTIIKLWSVSSVTPWSWRPDFVVESSPNVLYQIFAN